MQRVDGLIRYSAVLLSVMVVALLAPAAASAASAATFVSGADDQYVASASDSNDCSVESTPCATLAGALAQTAASGTVYVAGILSQSGAISLDENVTIAANPDPHATSPVIAGNSGDTDGLLTIGDVSVTIKGLTVENGQNDHCGEGGAITNNSGGVLAVTGSTFIGNIADCAATVSLAPDGDGGAIDNGEGDGSTGTLMVTDSTFADNAAAAGDGGAIDNGDHGGHGVVTVTDSTFTGNVADYDLTEYPWGDGGAIDSADYDGTGTLTVSNSSFTDNTAPYGDAGAIDNADSGVATLTVTDSTFSANSADDYDGGAIDNGDDGGDGTLTVTGSTLDGNYAGGEGGAIDNGDSGGGGSATVTSSTLTGNSARSSGDTIENGQGGGSGTVVIAADVFAGACGQAAGTWDDYGFNAATDASCLGTPPADQPDAAVSAAAGDLGSLANNGGPTQTMELLADNPAIDLMPSGASFTVPAGGSSVPVTCPLTDQRGVSNPGTTGCDAGAVQYAAQDVSFGPGTPTTAVVGQAGYTATVSSTSGLPVALSLDPDTTNSACSLAADTITFNHVGSCVIDANQAGDVAFTAAAQVQQTIVVGQASQAISFPTPAAGTIGGGEVLSATGGASGQPVVFSVDADTTNSACVVSGTHGTTVSFSHAGSCVIDANQAGDGDYAAAAQVQRTIVVGQASQTISFPAPGGGIVGASEGLSATGGSSGKPVVFSVDPGSSPAGACAVSGSDGATVTFDHAGSCVIDANQAGDGDYAAAAQVQRAIAVGQASQSISFPAPAGGTVGGSELLSATGGASGQPVAFSVDSSTTNSACTVSGDTVSFGHAGSCVIDANQAGDGDYAVAPEVQRTIVVAKGSQAIGFSVAGGAAVGGSEVLSATGGASGEPVAFSVDSSTTNSACTVSGDTVSFAHAGSCVIDANQAGDGDYAAAAQVRQTIVVADGSQSISFSVAGGAAVGGSEVLSATGGASGQPVVFSVDSTTTNSACTLLAGTVSFDHVGSCVIDANQAGDGDYAAAAQVQQTVVVAAGSQSISFSVTGAAAVGGSEVLSATGGASGEPVVFSVDSTTTNSACTLTGDTVSFDFDGSCVIDANQAGDGDYAAAAQVQRTIVVGQASQAMSFPAPGGGTVGGAEVLSATGGASGEPVAFSVDSSTTNAACTLSGDTVSFDHAGSCVIDATQAGDGDYAAATQTQQTIPVSAARTSTSVVAGASTLTATVAAQEPGGGAPAGTVLFMIGGQTVGSANLVNGAATLAYSVPDNTTETITADYQGDNDYDSSTSSVSVSGPAVVITPQTVVDPTITAGLSSASAKNAKGWWRSPVSASFTCTVYDSALTAPCPAAMYLDNSGKGQTLTRTIATQNGGGATVTVSGINIDLTKPKVSITGLGSKVSNGTKRTKARCVASDPVSGISSCTLTHQLKRTATGEEIVYTAKATSNAGNTSTTRVVVQMRNGPISPSAG